jgi:heme exporter protein C
MSTALGWLAVAALAAGLGMGFGVAPREVTQGNVQRIMYLHVPAVWVAYLAFTAGLVASIVYLARRRPGADRLAHAACEVGTVFLGVNIATGAIWGKPTWGTWWTWDARLTLTLFLWLIYAGYLVLRGAIPEPEMRARYSAVLGILGALLIPFIHMSVYLFRTLHPMPIVLKPDRPSLPGAMLTTLLFSFCAFFLVYVALLRARYNLAVERARLAEREGHSYGER